MKYSPSELSFGQIKFPVIDLYANSQKFAFYARCGAYKNN